MHDDKRQLRRHKRAVKQAGNRRRRRYLKNVDADPEAFDLQFDRSDVMNTPRPQRIREDVDR